MTDHQSHFDDRSMTWNTPELLETSKGLWPTAGLERSELLSENEHEWSAVVEYRLSGEIVHRSVRTHIKQSVIAEGLAATFG